MSNEGTKMLGSRLLGRLRDKLTGRKPVTVAQPVPKQANPDRTVTVVEPVGAVGITVVRQSSYKRNKRLPRAAVLHHCTDGYYFKMPKLAPMSGPCPNPEAATRTALANMEVNRGATN